MISFDPDVAKEWLLVIGRTDSTVWCMADTLVEALELIKDEGEDDKVHSIRLYRNPNHGTEVRPSVR